MIFIFFCNLNSYFHQKLILDFSLHAITWYGFKNIFTLIEQFIEILNFEIVWFFSINIKFTNIHKGPRAYTAYSFSTVCSVTHIISIISHLKYLYLCHSMMFEIYNSIHFSTIFIRVR